MRVLLCLAICAVAGAQALPGDRVIPTGFVVGSLSFSGDGSLIAATCADGKLRLWDPRTGELKRAVSLDQFNKDDRAFTLTEGADLLATAGRDGSIRILDPKTGQIIRQFAGRTRGIRDLVFSKSRALIAGANRTRDDGSEYTVRVWDGSGREQLALPAGLGGISAMAFSPDGGTLVAAGFDTNLRAWSTRNGELLRLMDELPLAMFAAAFSPDGKYLATAGADRIVYLWDAKTWKIARKLSGQPEMISAMAFSPDSRLLLTGGFSEFTVRNPVKIILWDLGSGKLLRNMASANMIRSAAFSADGTLAATANAEQAVSIWAVPPATGR